MTCTQFCYKYELLFYIIYYSYHSSISGHISQSLGSLSISDVNTASYPDTALVDWLQNLEIDQPSINRVSILQLSRIIE